MSADEIEKPKSSGEHQEVSLVSEPTGVESPGIFRRLPIICFFIALIYFLIGRLRFPKRFVFRSIEVDEDQVFTVFRHMKRRTEKCHLKANAQMQRLDIDSKTIMSKRISTCASTESCLRRR